MICIGDISITVRTFRDGLLQISLQIVKGKHGLAIATQCWTSLEFAETHLILLTSQTSSLFWRCQTLAERLYPICTRYDAQHGRIDNVLIWIPDYMMSILSKNNAVQHNKICFGLSNNESPRSKHLPESWQSGRLAWRCPVFVHSSHTDFALHFSMLRFVLPWQNGDCDLAFQHSYHLVPLDLLSWRKEYYDMEYSSVLLSTCGCFQK